MKKALPVALLITLFSCLTEENADPGKASTFLRYYNGGFDDQAQAFEETPDKGYILLASTQFTDNNADIQPSKIKLIKVDQFGNTLWQTLYPTFDDASNTSYYKGRGLLVEKDGSGNVTGYTIAGDRIDSSTGISHLFIMQTDANGNFTRGTIHPLENVQGQSLAKDNSGYLVLGSRVVAEEDMIVARFNASNLTLDWTREYGEGGSSFVTGLTTDSQNNIYWGGTVSKNNGPTAMRLIKTAPGEIGTLFDRDFGLPEYNEETGGICYSDFGPYFAFIGTTDENENKDILYQKVSANGEILLTKIIGSEAPEEGNAICTTGDGGLLIIGTSGLDEARDYYMIKLNHLGDVLWSKVFGSKKPDRGVSVRQVSDGSYVILGSTTLGGLNSIMLMKTDSQGNIE
jgi:hypothetical protein